MLRQREAYESFGNENGEGSYIIIGAPANESRRGGSNEDDDFDNDTREQTTVKMESVDSPKRSIVPSGKKDGNV